MFGYFKKPALRKLWNQAHGPGSFDSDSSLRESTHHHREITAFMAAFILFGLFSAGGTLDSAVAAPGVSGKSGYYAEVERRNLRHFVHSNPDNILRLKGREVAFAMNKPELVRHEFPSVVWQYRTNECVLDVYFASMDEDVSGAPVVHYEVRSREKHMSDDDVFQICVDKLTAQKNPLVMAKASSFYKRK
ncbi:MAG: hypothetical protein DHS20C02_09680 [Micavibrio sp.]|nr:MAG: hypothetical protein DHS20C02_09680 [Micavibrio sp.]